MRQYLCPAETIFLNSLKILIKMPKETNPKTRIINRDAIIYDEPYMVVTKDDNLKTVKFVKEHKEKKKLWLVPYNIEQFNEQTILKEDILELYRVVGLFRTV